MDSTVTDPNALFDRAQRDLGVGTAWLVVLAVIAKATGKSGGAVHGYEIARQLTDSAPPGVAMKHGTLYPILRTMEAEGLVTSQLVASNEGPARKCFTLTPAGRATLDVWAEAWGRTRVWVDGIVESGRG